jgi:CubicO group peptidase (beta-lactamase class C family)
MVDTRVQAEVERLLRSLVEDGSERGLQVAVYKGGELVVDACAGWADVERTQPVTAETLFPVFSSTKPVAATVAHRLVERGLFAYDTPVVDLWPEFAAHDKRGVRVRHLLDHSAGLALIPRELGPAQMYDWDVACALMAASPATNPPGAKYEYHAVTFGWLVGEVCHRATGVPFQTLIQDEIARPLGLRKLFVGITDDVEPRVSTLTEMFGEGFKLPVDDGKPSAIPAWMWPLGAWMNEPAPRRACIPASNGIMTARDLAAFYAAHLPGGLGGIELLPESRVRAATAPQRSTNPDNPDAGWMSLGYALGGPNSDMLGGRNASFGHGGYGGSLAFADVESRLAIAVAKNHFSPRGATRRIVELVRTVLK